MTIWNTICHFVRGWSGNVEEKEDSGSKHWFCFQLRQRAREGGKEKKKHERKEKGNDGKETGFVILIGLVFWYPWSEKWCWFCLILLQILVHVSVPLVVCSGNDVPQMTLVELSEQRCWWLARARFKTVIYVAMWDVPWNSTSWSTDWIEVPLPWLEVTYCP